MSASKKNEEINLEKSITELEEIVKSLEKNDISLEESLKLFERGVILSGQCTKLLDDAEQKVNVLLKKDGSIVEDVFSNKDED